MGLSADLGRSDGMEPVKGSLDQPMKVQSHGMSDSEHVRLLTNDLIAADIDEERLARENQALKRENALLQREHALLRQTHTQYMQAMASNIGPAAGNWWPHLQGWPGVPGEAAMQPGVAVVFQGLKNATDLNGKVGVVERWDEESNRWVVRLETGEVKFAKPENLTASQANFFVPPYFMDPTMLSHQSPSGKPGRTNGRKYTSATDATTATPGRKSSMNSRPSAVSFGLESESPDKVEGPHTTVMMRNIPNNYTRELLISLLNAQGFKGGYDLVYLPIDFQTEVGLGYAFINLVSPEEADRFRSHFQGFSEWDVVSQKTCEVSWSDALQGVDAHIDRYRNSPVMHESVPDDFKPVLYQDGERVPFPVPTKRIRAPRLRRHAPSR